jgi:hypothetical protein
MFFASRRTGVEPDIDFTGERFIPGISGEIVYEHVHRYAFARRLAAGLRVLDAACGEGYGSALLAEVANSVIGVDIDADTVLKAEATYGGLANLAFRSGSVTSLPLGNASVDLVVSFETIEHLEAADQPRMLAEFARVLAPDGVLVLSSPNRPQYSEARNYRNPFHLHELDRNELATLVGQVFPAQRWYRQRMWLGSAVLPEGPAAGHELLDGSPQGVGKAESLEAMYFVVVAARRGPALPVVPDVVSLLSDRAESERARIDDQAREVMRLDSLLADRDATLERRAEHIAHLEGLVAFRDNVVVERDALLEKRTGQLHALEQAINDANEAIADLGRERTAQDVTIATQEGEISNARAAHASAREECGRLERALAAQERIINYRQSARWWLALPWIRARLLFSRFRPK